VRADHSAGMGEGGVNVPVGNANGAIIKAKGEKTLWHMGDTDIFSDMALLSEIHGVEACICPIGDRFTMGGKVAALAMTPLRQAEGGDPLPLRHVPDDRPERRCLRRRAEGQRVEVWCRRRARLSRSN
jgi:hypothetical protein